MFFCNIYIYIQIFVFYIYLFKYIIQLFIFSSFISFINIFSPLNNLFLLATFGQGAWGETYIAQPCQTFCQGMTGICARASHASIGQISIAPPLPLLTETLLSRVGGPFGKEPPGPKALAQQLFSQSSGLLFG